MAITAACRDPPRLVLREQLGRRCAAEFPIAALGFSLCHPSQHFLIIIVIQTSGANAWRKPMHYIAYGLAIFAAVLAIVFVTGNMPRDATASHNDPNYTAVR
jgi:hypothetical protein